MKNYLFALLLLCTACMGPKGDKHLADLRCEGLENPLGIDNKEPHFSWKTLTEQPFQQDAYEIEVASCPKLLAQGKADMWQSGRVESNEQVMVPYKGNELKPRQMYFWRIKAYSGEQCLGWSEIQRFSVGICEGEKLQSEYIGMGLGQETSVLLRGRVNLDKKAKAALLYVNSLGYHELYVNGTKVDDAVLSPAVSQLDKRSRILTYDVASLLKKGQNEVVLWLGSGWYKEAGYYHAQYKGPAARAELDVLQDGNWQTVLKTGADWQGCESGYKDTGNWKPGGFGGERIDASLVPADLMPKTLENREWKPVEIAPIQGIESSQQMCQKTVRKETVNAVEVKPFGENTWLVDMGKVLNGQFDIQLPALPAGTEVKASFCDHLNAEGTGLDGYIFHDQYIASGNEQGDRFVNRFNHHVFRYVQLSNLSTEPDVTKIKAYRIGLNANETGTFECSDEDLNAIHQMFHYTMDNLCFCGYMVDCAHIERLGYGGDGNASTLSLQNNFDVAPMYMNWLQGWNDAIRPDGSLPHVAPCPNNAGGGPYWCTFIVQAPWRTWMNFGDDRLLYRCYDNMKLWLSYVDAYTQEGLLKKWPDTDYRNWYLGDWLAPHGVDVRNEETVDLVNNCALVQTYNELIQIAEYLNKPEDKADFEARKQALSARIHEVYFHPETNTYGTGTQLDMSYPLLTGLVPEENLKAVKETLLARTDSTYNGHLNVGLVGVPILAEWATKAKQADFIYKMLKKEDYPGYLYMIRRGGTSTWEDWDNPRSYLHNCFNGLDSWFYQALGGIIPTSPGYRTVYIDPQMPEGLEWANVTRETPYGKIEIKWSKTPEGKDIEIVIPNGITADFMGTESLGAGTSKYHFDK